MFRLSEKFEVLAESVGSYADTAPDDDALPTPEACFDVVIVGSGYGGAVAAARLAGLTAPDGIRDLRVVVLERGKEWLPGDFPESIAELPRAMHVQQSRERRALGPTDALFRVYANGDISAVVHSALGGGSQANASVAERADAAVFRRDPWPFELKRDAGENPERFAKYQRRAERLLGLTRRTTDAHHYTKQRRFASLAAAMPAPSPDAPPRPVRIAVHRPDSRNPTARPDPAIRMATNRFGVSRHACIGCGNCVTGCNYHAKNTLATNYLPIARHRGADIYTEAHVAHVERVTSDRIPYRWLVRVLPTDAEKRPERRRKKDQATLYANVVILAAGTFGSTEILLRSKKQGLSLSKAIGSRFSANGDGLHFRYCEDDNVNAVAGFDDRHPVGPTITHMFDGRGGPGPLEKHVVMQDGAIPRALAEVFGEIVTTGGLLAELGEFRTRVDKAAHTDALAVSPEALKCTQVLLAMGHDSATGKLELDALTNELDDPGFKPVRVSWPVRDGEACDDAQEALLTLPDRAGVSLVDPIGRPLPRALTSVLTTVPKGPRLTVHPLGGCPMADGSDRGVVNHKGQVYVGSPRTATTALRASRRPSGAVQPQRRQDESPPDPVHPGLYVLDGSIIPTSLGINPSLTITALAERAIDLLRLEERWKKRTKAAQRPSPLREIPAKEYRTPPSPPDLWPHVTVNLKERLRLEPAEGKAKTPTGVPAAWYELFGETPNPPPGVKHAVLLDLEYVVDHIHDMLQARGTLDDPGKLRHLTLEHGSLVLAEDRSQLVLGSRYIEIKAIEVTGTMDFFVPEPASTLTQTLRGLVSWWKVRGKIEVLRGIDQIRSRRGPGRNALTDVFAKLSIVPVACHAGEHRHVRYDLQFESGGRPYRLGGSKIVAFDEHVNAWRSMLEFDARVVERGPQDGVGRLVTEGRFALDVVDLMRDRLPTIIKEPDAVSGLMAMTSFGAYFARMMFAIQLFRFQAPDYPADNCIAPRRRTATQLDRCHGPEFHTVKVKRAIAGSPGADPDLELLLTRYSPSPRPTRNYPVVLFPGFAASSLQFTTNEIGEGSRNLPQVLCAQGFDVWVADVRTSSALPTCEFQWDFDTVAAVDVRAMVETVMRLTGRPKVHLLGHCMGGAIISMAALAHPPLQVELPGGSAIALRDCVQSYVFSQVTPFVVASAANALRAELIATLRDALGISSVHPTVDRPPTVVEALFDRIAWSCPIPEASSYPFTMEEAPHVATIKRLSAMLGVMWLRKNVSTEMENAFGDCYGPGNLSTFWQIMHFAKKGRVVDQEARNTYATDPNLREVFARAPALVVHGEQSQMFDPRGSEQFVEHVNALFGYPDNPPHAFYVGLPEYGHFDPIIGKDAHIEVHPLIADYLAKTDQPAVAAKPAVRGSKASRAPANQAVLLPPVTGPVLGWVRRSPAVTGGATAEGVRYARIAFDISRESTAEVKSALFFLLDAPTPPVGLGAPGARRPVFVKGWRVVPVNKEFDDMAAIAVADIPLPDDRAHVVLCLGEYQAPGGRIHMDDYSSTRAERDLPGWRADQKIEMAMFSAPPPVTGVEECPVPEGDTLAPVIIGRGAANVLAGVPGAAIVAYDASSNVLLDDAVSVPGECATGRTEPVPINATDLAQFAQYFERADLAFPITDDEIDNAFVQIPAERTDDGTITFALASCMSPGTPFNHAQSDHRIGQLLGEVEKGSCAPDLALLVGDQVYLDDNADLFTSTTPREYFFKRYRDVFKLKNFRTLLRQLPVYMAPDDHEVFDNYNGLQGLPLPQPNKLDEQVKWCMTAYDAFQGSHSPGSVVLRPSGMVGRLGQQRWYTFEAHGFPFFVMDTRLERQRSADQFVSEEQLAALLQFLTDHQNEVKFVASGSILFPALRATASNPRAYALHDDSWLGYPRYAERVFQHIRDGGIDRTIFLAGDAHCSIFTRIEIQCGTRAQPLHAWSIVSSGLYTPYPFANNAPHEYMLDSGELPPESWLRRDLRELSWRNLAQFQEPCYAIVRVRKSGELVQVGVEFHGAHRLAEKADASGPAPPALSQAA